MEAVKVAAQVEKEMRVVSEAEKVKEALKGMGKGGGGGEGE